MWTEDEAGPYPTRPHPGQPWQPPRKPARYPHEYLRDGTAKQLTLLHPARGAIWIKGVKQSAHVVLHPWLKAELAAILAALPGPLGTPSVAHRPVWERWQEGLTMRISLPQARPPIRLLLVLDNPTGHLTPSLVLW